MVRVLPAAAGIAVLVAWWVLPILTRITDCVPGAGPGDNLAFVWNVWWTRYALTHSGQSVFFSPLLFHPFGANLALHTNTLLPAILVSPVANPVLAQNVLIVAHLVLNFVAAYALAWHQTRHQIASIVAAVIFGWSPFISGHLPGHFNLIAAWTLPVCALAALKGCERPGSSRGAFLGLALACTAYIDYYYFIYGLILAALLCVSDALVLERFERTAARWERIGTVLAAGVTVAALATAFWILIGGGGDFRIAGVRVSAHSAANPLAAAWLMVLVWGAARVLRSCRVRIDVAALRARVTMAAAAAITTAVLLSPLLMHALALWRSGDYATQHYFWRSAPAGVDLATFVFGNPYSLFYGSAVSPVYRGLRVDLVEHVAWFGPAVIALTAIAVRRSRAASRWILPAIVFAIWALGPYVEAAGRATTLWLPAIVIRWIPIVSNARIPARAIVVVYLASAILSAHGTAWLLGRSRRGAIAAIGLIALLVLDYAPRRPALYQVERPAVYAQLPNDGTPGAVCELPLGFRDGFGETGVFDPRILTYQTIHQRPMLGGFLARLPRWVGERYNAMPVTGALLRLSAGGSLAVEHPDADRERAAAALTSAGIKYIVVNHRTAPPDLVTYVRRVLPLRVIARDDERAIYIVDPSVY